MLRASSGSGLAEVGVEVVLTTIATIAAMEEPAVAVDPAAAAAAAMGVQSVPA
jgi:hypothetical protein